MAEQQEQPSSGTNVKPQIERPNPFQYQGNTCETTEKILQTLPFGSSIPQEQRNAIFNEVKD